MYVDEDKHSMCTAFLSFLYLSFNVCIHAEKKWERSIKASRLEKKERKKKEIVTFGIPSVRATPRCMWHNIVRDFKHLAMVLNCHCCTVLLLNLFGFDVFPVYIFVHFFCEYEVWSHPKFMSSFFLWPWFTFTSQNLNMPNHYYNMATFSEKLFNFSRYILLIMCYFLNVFQVHASDNV